MENARSEVIAEPSRAPVPSSQLHQLYINGFHVGNTAIHIKSSSSGEEDQPRNQMEEKSEANHAPQSANAARYKMMSPACLPITRSPCLTIPPGLSPTTLLDSPVLLSNMKAEPSPTTGTFSLPHLMHDTGGSDSFASSREPSNCSSVDEVGIDEFEFKPPNLPCSSSGPSSFGPLASMGSNRPQSKPSPLSLATEIMSVASQDLTLSVLPSNPSVYTRESLASESFSYRGHQSESLDNETNVSLSESRTLNPTGDDGYNWRKYGQKHVKGSEFPRSYYKCTHPNCQVKKQLERSQDGQITEIIYKGTHDHPKPLASRRAAIGQFSSRLDDERSNNLPSLVAEDHPSGTQVEPIGEPNMCANDDTGAALDSSMVGEETDADEDPELKRRRRDAGFVDVTSYGKVSREPRVVVQTVSEVDILDDGYRWRKYGQKVVKGNPNPRSYYKCTNVGCPVRKHVERASHDPKAVITTYEGKHNHDVPTGRNGNSEISHDANAVNVPAFCEALGIDQFDGSDSISLDLGVGMGSTLENGQSMETIHSSMPVGLPFYGQMIQAVPISSYHNLIMNGSDQFMSRENPDEGFGFVTSSLGHSSNSYQKLLLGP